MPGNADEPPEAREENEQDGRIDYLGETATGLAVIGAAADETRNLHFIDERYFRVLTSWHELVGEIGARRKFAKALLASMLTAACFIMRYFLVTSHPPERGGFQLWSLLNADVWDLMPLAFTRIANWNLTFSKSTKEKLGISDANVETWFKNERPVMPDSVKGFIVGNQQVWKGDEDREELEDSDYAELEEVAFRFQRLRRVFDLIVKLIITKWYADSSAGDRKVAGRFILSDQKMRRRWGRLGAAFPFEGEEWTPGAVVDVAVHEARENITYVLDRAPV